MLTLNEYQKQAGFTDQSPTTLWYYGLGLTGEAGEVVELLKKYYRKVHANTWEDSDMPRLREKLLGELGDVFWYLSRLASAFGLSLEEVAQFNLEKLQNRKKEKSIVR